MRIAIDALFEHPDHYSSALDYLRRLATDLPPMAPMHSFYILVSPRMARHFEGLAMHNLQLVNCLVSNENLPLRILAQQTLIPYQMARRKLDLLFAAGNVCPIVPGFCTVLKISTLHHEETRELIGRARSTYRRIAFRISARRANHILANSWTTKQGICRLCRVEESKVSVVYEASEKFFGPRKDAPRVVYEKYGISRDYIFYASSLWPYKNHEGLLRAFARLVHEKRCDYELVIAGRGELGYLSKLQELARNLDIANRVRFLGVVPLNEMPYLYSAALVFAYPSLSETFGKPLVEAMSCGIPIVASKRSCIPEILGGAGLLVNPLDSVEMSEMIYRACKEPALRQKLVESGLRRSKEFSWVAQARQTLEVMEQTYQRWAQK